MNTNKFKFKNKNLKIKKIQETKLHEILRFPAGIISGLGIIWGAIPGRNTNWQDNLYPTKTLRAVTWVVKTNKKILTAVPLGEERGLLSRTVAG